MPDLQCQPPISSRLPRSCLELGMVLMKLVPRFFLNGNSIWLWKACSRGFRVSMSNSHWISKTYIYFANFPWVGEQKRPRGPYSWPPHLERSIRRMSPELAVLFFYLAGECALYCIFLHVCLKWRMTKGQEHFGGGSAKKGKAKNWRSYATIEAECLEMCFSLIFSISWERRLCLFLPMLAV